MAQESRPRGEVVPQETVATAVTPATLAPGELGLALTPFLLLFFAQLLSWAWHAAGLGGAVGSIEPPSLVALALLLAGGAWAFRQRLPLRWYGWGALGLTAATALVQAAVIGVLDSGDNGVSRTTLSAAVGIPGLVVLATAIVTAVVVAGRGVRHGLLFFALFQAFPMVHFSIIRAGDFVSTGEGLALTAGVAAIAAVQMGLVLWLLRRFFLADLVGQTRAVALLVVLVLLHALVSQWTLFFTSLPETAASLYASSVLSWMLFNLIFLAVVYATGRMRQRLPRAAP